MLLKQLFSRRVGYAAHALCLMVQMQPLTTVRIADLARHMTGIWPRTSATYLSKVVRALVEAKILASVRGWAGGYRLTRPAASVSLLDVVCALEGSLDGKCPLTPSGPCAWRAGCTNYFLLTQLQDDVAELLSRITIQQLARNLPHMSNQQPAVNCANLSPLWSGNAPDGDSVFSPTVPFPT